jgi:hypothetical protein
MTTEAGACSEDSGMAGRFPVRMSCQGSGEA